MNAKIHTYEQAIAKEIACTFERKALLAKQDESLVRHNARCAELINKYLKESGSTKRYDVTCYSCPENFIVDNFEGAEQINLIKFCEKNIPAYVEISIPAKLWYSSYRAFNELGISLKLTRRDFSSAQYYNVYKEHVFSATHDFD